MERYVKLHDVPQVVYELTGIPRSRNTAYVWVTKGRISSQGRRIKLKANRHLGQWYTTRTWIETFIREVG